MLAERISGTQERFRVSAIRLLASGSCGVIVIDSRTGQEHVIDEVDRNGGTVKLTQEGWFQRRIADFAYETALKKAEGRKTVIGVNRYVDADEKFDIELHPYDPSTAKRQIARLERVRRERDNAKVNALLARLVAVAQREDENILPVTIDLVAAGATMGDIVEKLKTLWGSYRENPVF